MPPGVIFEIADASVVGADAVPAAPALPVGETYRALLLSAACDVDVATATTAEAPTATTAAAANARAPTRAGRRRAVLETMEIGVPLLGGVRRAEVVPGPLRVSRRGSM